MTILTWTKLSKENIEEKASSYTSTSFFFKIAGVYVLLIFTKGEQLKAPEGFVFALLLKNTKPKRGPRSG